MLDNEFSLRIVKYLMDQSCIEIRTCILKSLINHAISSHSDHQTGFKSLFTPDLELLSLMEHQMMSMDQHELSLLQNNKNGQFII